MHNYYSELVCDLAETYHILNYKSLPATQVAIFLYGLRDTSRVKAAMSEQNATFEQIMLAGIFDRLAWLCWSNTKDGQKNRNRPESITDKLLAKSQTDNDIKAFATGEEFEMERLKIITKGGT